MRLLDDDRRLRVGLSGSGYVAAGLLRTLSRFSDVTLSGVFTARHPRTDASFTRPELLTRDLDALVQGSDVIVECSGSVRRGITVAEATVRAGLPLVTVNAEFQVTAGHLFAGRGLISEAEGDQPAALAVLDAEVRQMGFRPLVYGNVKGFLNTNPDLQEMRRQATAHGISLAQVTSFTDGTKLHIEQALVANGLGADLIRDGMLGPRGNTLQDCITTLVDCAAASRSPVSDFCMPARTDVHLFIVATHPDAAMRGPLQHLKLGGGPYYVFTATRHLAFLEVPRTIRRLVQTTRPVLSNGTAPRASVIAITKTSVPAGTRLITAVGSREVRGIAVRHADNPDLVPIGLLEGATIRRTLTPDTCLTWDDVELDGTLATVAATQP